jgi:2,4-dienoyl-CoA reductase-like NADH-dependent reductase (Old Yellow Enzyme family)
MTSNDPLLRSFRLGSLTLHNRIVSTSHAAGLGEAGMPAGRYQRYHEEKARGGIGMTMFGGSSNVSIDSPSFMPQLNMWSDDVIPHLTQFSDRIHAQGSTLMCQLTHLGRRGEFDKGAVLPTIAPSVSRENLHRSIPKEMDSHDVRRVIKDFGAAARRCQLGGLDGIECLAGAHLIGQFLSPVTNQRNDAYGGTVENRCRFGIEVFHEIRKQVCSDFVVGFRFIIDEGYAEGLNFDESLEMARIFQAEGCLDFFNAMYGRMDTLATLYNETMPGMGIPSSPWLEKAGAFREKIDLPVIHATKIADVATARHAIREGLIDLVGMTRAHIADPHIVNKIAAGQEDRIRPCVGATHCMTHMRPTCLHNPATGHENVLHQQIKHADIKRKVVVVGAGPAGLEAARVCGERGHDVTVLEAAARAGGQVLLAARASWRKDIIGIVDWRISELEKLGVDLRCNVYAEKQDIKALAPDLVIVATGGIPNTGRVPGAQLITSPWDILSGAVSPAQDVLIVDGTGRHVALTVADHCHQVGSKLQFATIDEGLAQEQGNAERTSWRKWAAEAGMLTYLSEHSLLAVRQDGNGLVATLRSELTLQTQEVRAGQIIYDYGTLPADEEYVGLVPASRNAGITDLDVLVRGERQSEVSSNTQDGGFELHRIGDAVASRNIHSAIKDALRLCQNA